MRGRAHQQRRLVVFWDPCALIAVDALYGVQRSVCPVLRRHSGGRRARLRDVCTPTPLAGETYSPAQIWGM